MQSARDTLDRMIAERGESCAALSRMLGRNASYLQQYLRRGSPRVLPERDRAMLARYFGVAETVLGGPDLPMPLAAVPRLDIAASAGPGGLVDIEQAGRAARFDPVRHDPELDPAYAQTAEPADGLGRERDPVVGAN